MDTITHQSSLSEDFAVEPLYLTIPIGIVCGIWLFEFHKCKTKNYKEKCLLTNWHVIQWNITNLMAIYNSGGGKEKAIA